MAEEDPEGITETGGSLRAKLEASNAANRELESQLKPLLVAQEISSKGYKYVTPDDLKDVSLSELATKAAALEKSKIAARADVVKSILKDQGVADDELDAEVERFLNPDRTESHAEQSTRLADLGRIGGRISPSDKDKGLHGQDLIEAALQEKYAKNRRR
jgi:hypothetical protein